MVLVKRYFSAVHLPFTQVVQVLYIKSDGLNGRIQKIKKKDSTQKKICTQKINK